MSAIQPKKVFIIIISVLILFALLVIGVSLAIIFLKPGFKKDVSKEEQAEMESKAFFFDKNLSEYVRNEIIVSFKEGTGKTLIDQFLADNNFKIKKEIKESGFYVLSISEGKNPEKQTETLKQNSIIDVVSPNYYYYPLSAYPNDPGYQKGAQWNIDAIKMNEVWKDGPKPAEKQVIIAVIDSGIAYQDYIPADNDHNWTVKSNTPESTNENSWVLSAKKEGQYFIKDYLKTAFPIDLRKYIPALTDVRITYDYYSLLDSQGDIKVSLEIAKESDMGKANPWATIYTHEKKRNDRKKLTNRINIKKDYVGSRIYIRFRAEGWSEDVQTSSGLPRRLFYLDNIKVEVREDSPEYEWKPIFLDDSKKGKTENIWKRMEFKKAEELDKTIFVVPGEKDYTIRTNLVDNTNLPNDDWGHGTHIAGTIAQTTNNGIGVAGVAYGAVKIMPIKVIDAFGKYASCDLLVRAIYDAVHYKAKVINLSLGSSGKCSALERAVKDATDAKATIIAACGNMKESSCRYPAAYKEVISVGAINSKEKRAWYSNYDKNLSVVAPGGEFQTDKSKPIWKDASIFQQSFEYFPDEPMLFYGEIGTSFAAPHVTGAVALLLQKNPDLKPSEIKDIIECTAKDLGEKGRDNEYGYGLLDVEKVLKYEGESSCKKRFVCLACPNPVKADGEDKTTFFPLAFTEGANISASDITCDAAAKNKPEDKIKDYIITRKDYPFYWVDPNKYNQSVPECWNKDTCLQTYKFEGTKTMGLEVREFVPDGTTRVMATADCKVEAGKGVTKENDWYPFCCHGKAYISMFIDLSFSVPNMPNYCRYYEDYEKSDKSDNNFSNTFSIENIKKDPALREKFGISEENVNQIKYKFHLLVHSGLASLEVQWGDDVKAAQCY